MSKPACHTGIKIAVAFFGVPCALIFLSSAALFNRFPIVWDDTNTYLFSSFSHEVPIDRPVFYGLFIGALRLCGHSLWTVVVAQALLALFLIWTVISRQGSSLKASLVAITAATGLLSVATSLPWFVGQIMPDIFTGLLAMSFYLLLHRWETLSVISRALTCPIFLFCNLVHFSHIAISLGVLLSYFLYSFLTPSKSGIRNRLIIPALLLLSAVITIPTVNHRLTGRSFFSETGHVFLMNRLISHRIIYRLLSDHCADSHYVLCPFKAEFEKMNGEDYLWSENTVLKKIGGWTGARSATWKMIWDSFRFYPLSQIVSISKNTLWQLQLFEISDFLTPFSERDLVYRAIREKYPAEFPFFSASRQQQSQLRNMSGLLSFQRWVTVVSILAALGLWFLANLRPDLKELHDCQSLLGFMILFSIVNALVCASLSLPLHRFQARVVWLVSFSLIHTCIRAFFSRSNHYHAPGMAELGARRGAVPGLPHPKATTYAF